MKTKLTVLLLVITLATFGQKSDGYISSKAYRLQQASQINAKTADTADYTDFFTKEDGFIIIMSYINNEGIFSVDAGDEKIMFLGKVKTTNTLSETDTISYTSDYVAGGVDSLQNVTIVKTYLKGSFEDTGEKIFSFHMTCKNDTWDFIATEVITGKKDI